MRHRDSIKLRARIIGVSGKMHSGKTTVAGILNDQLTMSEFYPKMIKFASPLYDIQRMVYERCNLPQPAIKDRKLLQWIGTEWGREKDKDLWTNIWRRDVRNYLFKFTENRLGVVIADDIRFDNEAKLIKEMGGVVINVESSDEIRHARSPSTFEGIDHASEQDISKELIDATIYNSEELYDLRKNIKYLLTDGAI